MTSKSTAENNGVCVQFSQHVWKKDSCKNCSKPKLAHKANISNNIPKANAGINPVVKTPSLKTGEKPVKPIKKPSLSKAVLTKQLKNEIPNLEQKPADPIYDIYDVAAKGQSGKPVNINEEVKMEDSQDNAFLMATPYTVVDVIASTLEKNRLASQANQVTPLVPLNIALENSTDKVPSNKWNDFQSRALINAELANQFHGNKNTHLSAEGDCRKWKDVSPEPYKARLYEEIDDVFMDKVENFKKDASDKNSNNNGIDNDKSKKSPMQVADEEEKKNDDSGEKIKNKKDFLVETSLEDNVQPNNAKKTNLNEKKSSRSQDLKGNGGVKKGEKKSFLQRLLGKSSKSIECTDNAKLHAIVKNNSLSDILDGHDNDTHHDDKYKKKLSQGDLICHKSIDVLSDEGEKTETEESHRTSTGTTNGGDDMRGSGTSFSHVSTTHNDSLNGSSHDLKPAKFSLSSDDLDSVDEQKAHSPSASSSHHPSSTRLTSRNHTLFTSATMRRPVNSNRKSMTSSEARISRRMLLAPPPPPPSTSPTNSTHLSSASFTSATLNRPAVMCKKPEVEMKTLNSSPPANKVETSENKSSLLDGFMADLDAILKKGGVTLEAENQSKSLPRLHPFDQLSTASQAPKGVDTLPLTFAPLELDAQRFVQQRALPDIPTAPTTLLPPSATLLSSPTTTSPDNDNLYEVLPSVQNKRPQVEPPALPADKPRPAPRPAIRSVTMTTRQKRRGHEGGGRSLEAMVEDKVRVPVKLNDPLEEQFRKINILSLDTLHSFLEQSQQSSSVPPLNIEEVGVVNGVIDGKEVEQWLQRLEQNEGRVVYWRRCVFFHLQLFQDVTSVVMVRQASVLCLPLRPYHHPNVVRQVASFERSIAIPRCSIFFQNPSEHHYHFDLLPYSSICTLPDFTQRFKTAQGGKEDGGLKGLSNKQMVLLSLQVVDSLLHLHRLGVSLHRLQLHDILLVTEAGKTGELAKDSFPILLPTELDESSATEDQRELLHDLLLFLQHLLTCNQVTQQALSQRQSTQQPTPKFRSSNCHSPGDREARFLNCFFKVSSFLAAKSTGSWADVEVIRNVLEFALWGPESCEEEIRLVFIEPKRRDFFLWWLCCSRQRILNQLVVHSLSSASNKHPLTPHPSSNLSKPPHHDPTHPCKNLRDHLVRGEGACSGEEYSRVREASYLSKLSVDLLLDATKLLYF